MDRFALASVCFGCRCWSSEDETSTFGSPVFRRFFRPASPVDERFWLLACAFDPAALADSFEDIFGVGFFGGDAWDDGSGWAS